MHLARSLTVLAFLAPLAAAPSAAPAQALCTQESAVFFDKGKSSIGPEGKKLIEAIAEGIKPCGRILVVVTGHIDGGEVKTGPNLGAARAKAVANAMRKLMPSTPIVTADAGFSNPLIPTKPGVSEPQNRRIVIDVR